MAIPFERVYRMKSDKDSHWTIVMGLTPLPGMSGLWMWRASTGHPETSVAGKVLEGEDGKLVLVGDGRRTIFEPLTLESWENMRDDVSGFDALRPAIRTDSFLQAWYWDEFANDGDGNEISQGDILKRLSQIEAPGTERS
jgi:hypothetical protein